MYKFNCKSGFVRSLGGWKNHKSIRNFRTSWLCRSQTHYEILGLTESCTNEDIKKAFLEKAKMFHPDKNSQNPENHKLIIAINEAYSVLSKRHTRDLYDNHLAFKQKTYTSGLETDCPNERIVHYDGFWENRDRSKDKYYEGKAYYGIKGVKKVPNHYIATGAILFMVVGAIFHYFLAKISASYTLNQLQKRDFIASQNYIMAREKAIKNGNTRQLELLIEEYNKQNGRD